MTYSLFEGASATLFLRFFGPYWRRLPLLLVSAIVSTAAPLTIGEQLHVLIDSKLVTNDSAAFNEAGIVINVCVLLFAMSTAGRAYLSFRIAADMTADLRRALYAHALTLSPGFFDTTRIGDILSAITTDSLVIQNTLNAFIGPFIRHLLLITAAFAMLAAISPHLTALVVVLLLAILLAMRKLGLRAKPLSLAVQENLADLSAFAEESLNAIRTLQAFSQESEQSARFGAIVNRTVSAYGSLMGNHAVVILAATALGMGTMTITLWLGGLDVLTGQISTGALSTFLFSVMLLANSVISVGQSVTSFQGADGSARRLLALLDQASPIAVSTRPARLGSDEIRRISFREVSHRYSTDPGRLALRNFSLTIDREQVVALVGRSGSGKSTVLNLLLRFYDPMSGSISLDGVDLRCMDLEDLRRRIGLVSHHPPIFNGSAYANIRIGKPGASDAEVRDAAEAAAAAGFLDALPRGFDTVLGTKGTQLSHGQRQRIAIARAFLRDPEILLLDEPTSALDTESEDLVQRAIFRIASGRTTIIVAHRLATVLSCDQIIVLDHGSIVEVGTHSCLLNKNGLYAQLLSDKLFNGTEMYLGGNSGVHSVSLNSLARRGSRI